MTAIQKASTHPATSYFLEYKKPDVITIRIYVYSIHISRHQTFKNNMVEWVESEAKAKELRKPPANAQQLEK